MSCLGQAARSSQLSCCHEQVTGEWGEGSSVGTHGWLSCPERLALGQRGCSEVSVGILGPHIPGGGCMCSSKQEMLFRALCLLFIIS